MQNPDLRDERSLILTIEDAAKFEHLQTLVADGLFNALSTEDLYLYCAMRAVRDFGGLKGNISNATCWIQKAYELGYQRGAADARTRTRSNILKVLGLDA